MRALNLTRRSLMAGTAAVLAMPSVLRATTQRLGRLVLQTTASGPGILMAHARTIGAFDDIAETVDLPIWTGFDQMRAGRTRLDHYLPQSSAFGMVPAFRTRYQSVVHYGCYHAR